MWPFTQKVAKPRERLKLKITPPVAIGERFKYLGVEMVCCRHFAYGYEFQVVVAEYVTKHGEIRKIIFCPVDWACLEAERVR